MPMLPGWHACDMAAEMRSRSRQMLQDSCEIVKADERGTVTCEWRCEGRGVGAAAVALVSSLKTALGRALSAASGAPPAGVIRIRPRAVGADGRPAAWRVKTGSGGAPSTLRHRSAAHCAARRSAATWRIARSAVCIPTFWGPNGWPAGTSVGGNGVRGCLEHPR